MCFKKISFILTLFIISSLYGKEYQHPKNSYNQGLTHYQNNDLGQAMYHTKKALLLTPADPKIRDLFYTIRRDIELPEIYAKDQLGQRLLSIIFGYIAPQNSALVGGILFVLGSLLVSLLLLGKIIHHHKITIIGIWICFILSALSVIHALTQYYLYFSPDQRVIIQKTQAYEEPTVESTYLLDLPAGTEVNKVIQQDDFTLVRTLEGKEYWVLTTTVPPLWDDNQKASK